MPRQARVVALDVPHHITHRGNNRQDVFLSDEDRRRSRDGHLWRSRFYPSALGPNRLETALLYVDLNPVRAGLGHAGRIRLCANWAERLKRQQADSTESELRRTTLAGTPFADRRFAVN